MEKFFRLNLYYGLWHMWNNQKKNWIMCLSSSTKYFFRNNKRVISSITKTVMRSDKVREEQRNFLKNSEDPRPTKFFMKYKYRSKASGTFDYELRLREALKDDPNSDKLLSLKRKWENDEYMYDWDTYEDEKKNRKVDVC